MDEWVRSGLLVDMIVAATVVEGCALWAFHRRTGRGVSLQQYGLNLLSGIALLLAGRCRLAVDLRRPHCCVAGPRVGSGAPLGALTGLKARAWRVGRNA